MTNPFAYIRENINIIEAAGKYGIDINRNKKALCIFHNDIHPSMSFKNNIFKCFSCGASGSIIDLVMELFDLTPIQAIKKISVDYDLGLDLKADYTANMREIDEHNKNRAVLSKFEKWCNETYSKHARLLRQYNRDIENYKPILGEKILHPYYVKAIHERERVNYILDILLYGSDREKIEFYKDSKTKEHKTDYE